MKDDHLPWEAEVLSAGPLEINDESQRENLVDALEERLEALLSVYGCRPTPDGWRRLALSLLADQSRGGKPWIEVTTPGHRGDSAPGAPRKDYSDLIRHMGRLIKAAPGMTVKAAAELVAKERRKARLECPTAKTLQNIWTEQQKRPRGEFPFLPWMMMVDQALEDAASRLETKSQNPT